MQDLQAKLREGRATIQQQKIQRCSTILAHLYTPGWQGRLKKNDYMKADVSTIDGRHRTWCVEPVLIQDDILILLPDGMFTEGINLI